MVLFVLFHVLVRAQEPFYQILGPGKAAIEVLVGSSSPGFRINLPPLIGSAIV